MFKVLIIDDEVFIREGLQKAIDWKLINCEVVGEAEDGDEGYNLYQTLKPDIILTDIRMPGMDGLTMISKINTLDSICKIIILTGFRDFEYAQEALRLGAFRLLLKPTKSDEILFAASEAISEIKMIRSKDEALNNYRKKVHEYYGINCLTNDKVLADISEKNEKGSSHNFLIAKAINYIKENYYCDIDLKTVADEIYISTWYLSKLLKKETGFTFVDLLNKIRVEEAKKLLSQPQYKVYEIAQTVGFTDVPYFSKLFKKITGLTPLEYKNSIKG